MTAVGVNSRQKRPVEPGPERFAIVQEGSSMLGLLIRSLLEARFPSATIAAPDESGQPGRISVTNTANGRLVLVFTVNPGPTLSRLGTESLDASLLTFDASPEELAAGFDYLVGGPRFVSPSIAELGSVASRLDAPRLTARELEVLRLLGRGLANREIANELGLSPHTVRSHLQSISARLDVASRGKLTAKARSLGLI